MLLRAISSCNLLSRMCNTTDSQLLLILIVLREIIRCWNAKFTHSSPASSSVSSSISPSVRCRDASPAQLSQTFPVSCLLVKYFYPLDRLHYCTTYNEGSISFVIQFTKPTIIYVEERNSALCSEYLRQICILGAKI